MRFQLSSIGWHSALKGGEEVFHHFSVVKAAMFFWECFESLTGTDTRAPEHYFPPYLNTEYFLQHPLLL